MLGTISNILTAALFGLVILIFFWSGIKFFSDSNSKEIYSDIFIIVLGIVISFVPNMSNASHGAVVSNRAGLLVALAATISLLIHVKNK